MPWAPYIVKKNKLMNRRNVHQPFNVSRGTNAREMPETEHMNTDTSAIGLFLNQAIVAMQKILPQKPIPPKMT